MSATADIAWAAGLFEGEGCISIRDRPNTRAAGPSARLSLTSTDHDVALRFQRIVGGKLDESPYVRNGFAHHKPIWTWRIENAPGVIQVLRLLRPYLGERRAAKAEATTVVAWRSIFRQLAKRAEETPDGIRVKASPWHQLAEALGEE